MIQEIFNHRLINSYNKREPKDNDIVIVYNDSKILANLDNGIKYPSYSELNTSVIYLFDYDDKAAFLMLSDKTIPGYQFYTLPTLRANNPREMLFLGVTAAHLGMWYTNNRYCGKCGTKFDFKRDERALVCPSCKHVLYPTISPAVIVGVFSPDHKKILMTRYNLAHSSYNKYALIAGFTEIGEDLEGTVKREVKEETGLDVSNIHYFKSQPWGFSSSLLVGYTCVADDKQEIVVEEDELKEAKWFTRDEMPLSTDNGISLTWDMIESFRNKKLLE